MKPIYRPNIMEKNPIKILHSDTQQQQRDVSITAVLLSSSFDKIISALGSFSLRYSHKCFELTAPKI